MAILNKNLADCTYLNKFKTCTVYHLNVLSSQYHLSVTHSAESFSNDFNAQIIFMTYVKDF